MDMTIDQQVALDAALLPHVSRLRIGKSNFRLKSDISSKESTLQLVYDVLRLTPFFKAFLITTDVPEIYMQEFWATATVHHHSIRHSGEIRKLTDVNINKLHQPCRSFATIINKCLSGKSLGYDILRLNIKMQRREKRFTIPGLQRNSKVYKEYYIVATGATPPKIKASVRKTKSSFDTIVTPPLTAAAGTRLSTFAKGKQPGTDEGTGTIPGVPDVPTEESDEEISWKSSDEGDDDDEKRSDDQDEGDDDDDQKEGNDDDQDSDEEGNDEENIGLNVGREEGQDEEDDEDELYKDVNINLEGRVVQMVDVHTTQEYEDSHVTLTLAPTTVAPLPLSIPTLTPSTIATISTVPHGPTTLTTAPSTFLQNLPNFGLLFGFDHRLKTLEDNFSKFVQTNQFAGAVSSIPRIVQRYMDQRMNEAVKVAVQIQPDRLRNEAQAENEEFLKNLDENIQKIIKEQVKEQVKILIEKMKGNKSIHRSNEQRNLYKALVEDYESDKIILDTYKDIVTLKRRRDDDVDKDEEPFARSDWGSKRRREGKEPESVSALKEKATRTTGKSTQGVETSADDQPIAEPSQHPEWFSQQKKPQTLDRDWNETLPYTHRSIQPKISELAKQTDYRSTFNELMDTPVDFSAFLMNRLKVDTLTPELLARPTYELMKGSCKILVDLKFFLEEIYKATRDQLDWINPEGQQYPHNLLKPLPLIQNSQGHRVISFDHFINNDLEYLCGGALSRKLRQACSMGNLSLGRKRQQFYGFAINRESARDVYSKRRIIAVTELKIVEWHNYKHLDQITVLRDDDKLYKFKEGDFKRLRIQDIEVMLLLLACGRPLTRCRKLPEEAQSYKAGYIPDGTLTNVPTALDDRLKAKDEKDHEKLGEVCWWRLSRETSGCFNRPYDLSYDVLIFQSDAMHNPSQPLKVRKTLFQNSRRYTLFYRLSHSELVGIEKEALSSSLRSLN
nr:hypothetical protein [Tanacetum cinerariifolium]